MKIIGIILLVLVVGIGWIVYKFLTAEPEIMAPEDYETSVQTAGEIEARYLAHGGYEVSYYEEATAEKWAKYEVYYADEKGQTQTMAIERILREFFDKNDKEAKEK